MTFLAKYLTDGTTEWATKFKINTQKDMVALGTSTSDFGSYQLAAVINVLNNPGNVALIKTPLSGFCRQRRRFIYDFVDGSGECAAVPHQVGTERDCGLDWL